MKGDEVVERREERADPALLVDFSRNLHCCIEEIRR
jgi:hypothetical protein